jgi:hypothetical protein
MKIVSTVGVTWLLLSLASACGSKSDDSKPKGKDRQIGTFVCKTVENGACVEPTDTFDTATGKIHMVFTTKELPKNGDVYSTKWIAEDAGEAAPPNTVLATFDSTVGDIVAGTTSYTVEGEVKPPSKGWPKGQYRVEVMLGDKLVTSAKFKIQ